MKVSNHPKTRAVRVAQRLVQVEGARDSHPREVFVFQIVRLDGMYGGWRDATERSLGGCSLRNVPGYLIGRVWGCLQMRERAGGRREAENTAPSRKQRRR